MERSQFVQMELQNLHVKMEINLFVRMELSLVNQHVRMETNQPVQMAQVR